MSFINIIQISDTHLHKEPHQLHRDQDADQNLLAILKLIKHNEIKLDALLITGDITQHGDIVVMLQ